MIRCWRFFCWWLENFLFCSTQILCKKRWWIVKQCDTHTQGCLRSLLSYLLILKCASMNSWGKQTRLAFSKSSFLCLEIKKGISCALDMRIFRGIKNWVKSSYFQILSKQWTRKTRNLPNTTRLITPPQIEFPKMSNSKNDYNSSTFQTSKILVKLSFITLMEIAPTQICWVILMGSIPQMQQVEEILTKICCYFSNH